MMMKSNLVIDKALVESARSWILEKIKNPVVALEPDFNISNDKLMNAEKIRNLSKVDPVFWERWIEESNLLKAVSRNFLNPVMLRHAAFIKYQEITRETPIHQDEHLWGNSFQSAKTYWIALTRVHAENGGLCYVESAKEVYSHEYSLEYPNFKVINEEVCKNFDIKQMNLEEGEIAIWDGKTPHGSYKNNSSIIRIGMPIVFVEMEDIMNKWLSETLTVILGREVKDSEIESSFNELKGQSLKIVTLLSRFKKEFGINPDISDFVKEPSIEKLETVLAKKSSR